MTPYRDRPRRWLGVYEHAGHRLKHYAISIDRQWPDAGWLPGLLDLLQALPQPAVSAERPGVGLLIQHRGQGADYQILAWWDRENELPLRLSIRDHGSTRWRPPRGNESVCVWDLQLIGFERDCYVRCLLGERADPAAYLRSRCPDRD